MVLLIGDDTFMVMSETGQLAVGGDGLYRRGLRFANVYQWHLPVFEPGPLLLDASGDDGPPDTDRPAQAPAC